MSVTVFVAEISEFRSVLNEPSLIRCNAVSTMSILRGLAVWRDPINDTSLPAQSVGTLRREIQYNVPSQFGSM
jgi:hypothetical protein